MTRIFLYCNAFRAVLLSLLFVGSQTKHRTSSAPEARSTATNFAGRNVYGAMIGTDPMLADVLGRDFHRIPQGVNGTAKENAKRRLENGRNMLKELPINVEMWLSVFAQPCPHRKSKGNDRGVMMSHYQIWTDFIFQGRLNKDAKDDDLIVVLEDDAVIAVKNVTFSLHNEISKMEEADLLFLGWCYGRRFMPMCTHAYIVSRTGARKMLDNWDICNKESIDGQWKEMAKNKIFTWRKASSESYSSLRDGFEDNPEYFTRGIFTQRNGLVSFNHHGFQNNAG